MLLLDRFSCSTKLWILLVGSLSIIVALVIFYIKKVKNCKNISDQFRESHDRERQKRETLKTNTLRIGEIHKHEFARTRKNRLVDVNKTTTPVMASLDKESIGERNSRDLNHQLSSIMFIRDMDAVERQSREEKLAALKNEKTAVADNPHGLLSGSNNAGTAVSISECLCEEQGVIVEKEVAAEGVLSGPQSCAFCESLKKHQNELKNKVKNDSEGYAIALTASIEVDSAGNKAMGNEMCNNEYKGTNVNTYSSPDAVKEHKKNAIYSTGSDEDDQSEKNVANIDKSNNDIKMIEHTQSANIAALSASEEKGTAEITAAESAPAAVNAAVESEAGEEQGSLEITAAEPAPAAVNAAGKSEAGEEQGSLEITAAESAPAAVNAAVESEAGEEQGSLEITAAEPTPAAVNAAVESEAGEEQGSLEITAAESAPAAVNAAVESEAGEEQGSLEITAAEPAPAAVNTAVESEAGEEQGSLAITAAEPAPAAVNTAVESEAGEEQGSLEITAAEPAPAAVNAAVESEAGEEQGSLAITAAEPTPAAVNAAVESEAGEEQGSLAITAAEPAPAAVNAAVESEAGEEQGSLAITAAESAPAAVNVTEGSVVTEEKDTPNASLHIVNQSKVDIMGNPSSINNDQISAMNNDKAMVMTDSKQNASEEMPDFTMNDDNLLRSEKGDHETKVLKKRSIVNDPMTNDNTNHNQKLVKRQKFLRPDAKRR